MLAQRHLSKGICNLAGHKLDPTQGGFMVEENPAASEDVIAFTVVECDPMSIKLGHAIRATGVERRRFLLGDLLHLAEHFRRTRLVIPDAGVNHPDCFQKA